MSGSSARTGPLGRWFRSPRWDAVRYWALDLETSGLDPRADHILSVGMVPLVDGSILWGESFYSLVRPEAGYTPESAALAIHHIVPEEAARAPELDDVLRAVSERLADAVLLVHWAKLDVAFLRHATRRRSVPWPDPPVVDTTRLLSRASHRRRQLEPYAEGYPLDLARARREFGLPPYLRHHALFDALAAAELFLVLRARLGAETLRALR